MSHKISGSFLHDQNKDCWIYVTFLLFEERQAEIENSNNILVEKMISLSTINKPKETFVKDSLNYSYTKKVEREIDM